MLLLAARLQLSVHEILVILNGRSLTVTEERNQADDFHTALIRPRCAIDLLSVSEHGPAGAPSPRG
ncbi:hypothetical protein [Streptosporangium sandarakinum]|uniref:hypothetical protein n=1 Tax=Streptosporangium sandarakinum TaxID=1260955 RepID=UPI003714E837